MAQALEPLRWLRLPLRKRVTSRPPTPMWPTTRRGQPLERPTRNWGGSTPMPVTSINHRLYHFFNSDQGDPPPIFDSLQRPCCRNWLNRQLIAFTCRSRGQLRCPPSTPTYPPLTTRKVDPEPGWTVQKPCPCLKSNLKRPPNSCRITNWTTQRTFASKNSLLGRIFNTRF